MNRAEWICLQMFILILMLSKAVFASAEKELDSQEYKYPEDAGMRKTFVKWVDKTHTQISKGILNSSERFDALFGEKHFDEEIQNTQIKFTTSMEIAESEDPELRFPVHINLALPQLQNRLQLFVDAMLKEEEKSENVGTNTVANYGEDDENDETNIMVGIQYKILQKARQWLTLGIGIKVHSNDKAPLGKLWARKVFDFDPWALRLTQYVLWFKDDGWGETSRIDIDKRISHSMFLRMTSKVIWSKKSEGVGLAQSFWLRQRLSKNWAIALELSGSGHIEPAAVADKYMTKLALRRRIYKNWLFFEVEPKAQFLREDGFELSPLITFNFEIRFGNVVTP